MNLYITEQGTSIRKQGNHLRLTKADKLVGDYLISEISSVNIVGAASISSDAMASLHDAGANVAFLDRGGRFKGKYASQSAKNVYLRLAQYDAFRDRHESFEIARGFVVSKIESGIALLNACDKNPHNPFHFDARPAMQKSLQSAMDCSGTDKNTLRGIEGNAAKIYFSSFAQCLMNGIRFPGRKFHPCTDPVNALLSLGYAFTAKRIEALLETYGFDPAIGFLHEPEYGRASLACDMLEEFRHPLVDRLVLKMFNRKFIGATDFVRKSDSDDSPLQLTREGMAAFICHYEEFCDSPNRVVPDNEGASWNSLMRLRVEALRRRLLKKEQNTVGITTQEAA